MTELEQQLSTAFQQLSTQYAGDMQRLAKQNEDTQTQMKFLAEQLQKMTSRLDEQSKQNAILAQSLQRLTDTLSEV
jgi:hypothetical protein